MRFLAGASYSLSSLAVAASFSKEARASRKSEGRVEAIAVESK